MEENPEILAKTGEVTAANAAVTTTAILEEIQTKLTIAGMTPIGMKFVKIEAPKIEAAGMEWTNMEAIEINQHDTARQAQDQDQ